MARELAGRNERGYVAVQGDEPAIEGGQPALANSGELGQVRVGHLTMPDDAIESDLVVTEHLGPEVMTRVAEEDRQGLLC